MIENAFTSLSYYGKNALLFCAYISFFKSDDPAAVVAQKFENVLHSSKLILLINVCFPPFVFHSFWHI